MPTEEVHECIIQEVSLEYFILYSFTNGRFYLISNIYSPLKKSNHNTFLRRKIRLNKNKFEYIRNKCLNPEDVDYESFESPIVVGIMISNFCNLNCSYCLARNGSSYSEQNLLIKNEDILINRLIKSQIISLLVSGGEPTLYSNLPTFLDKMYNSNFLIMLDTNGTKLSYELIDTLKRVSIFPRISLDSVSDEIHNKNRGNFSDTFENIKKLINQGIEFRINTVIHNDNIYELEKIAEFMLENNIKTWHLFKLQQEFAPKSIWINDDIVEKNINLIREKYGDKLNIICKFTKNNDSFASFVIDSMGYCFSTDNKNETSKKIVFGNIFEKNIQDIWKSSPLDYRLRHYKKHLTYRGK